MILRRIADALRRQDWAQVTIELLIVVLGIFLGLQVQEWNEAREDRAAGAHYLSQIIEDLEKDLVNNKGILEQALPVKQRSLDRVYEMITTGTPIEPVISELPFAVNSPESGPTTIEINGLLALEYSTVFSWSFPQVRTTTYDDLQNSGKLALIADDRIRFLVSDYYDSSRNARERILARITGYSNALYKIVGGGVGGVRTPFTHTSTSGRLQFEQYGLNLNLSVEEFIARAQNEEFREYLRAETNYTAFLFDMAQEQINRTEKLLEILENSS